MPNPVLDPAINALRDTAAAKGSQSLLTFTPQGDALLFVGAEEPEVVEMFMAAMVEVQQRRESGS